MAQHAKVMRCWSEHSDGRQSKQRSRLFPYMIQFHKIKIPSKRHKLNPWTIMSTVPIYLNWSKTSVSTSNHKESLLRRNSGLTSWQHLFGRVIQNSLVEQRKPTDFDRLNMHSDLNGIGKSVLRFLDSGYNYVLPRTKMGSSCRIKENNIYHQIPTEVWKPCVHFWMWLFDYKKLWHWHALFIQSWYRSV